MKTINYLMIAALLAAPIFVPATHAVVTQKVTHDSFKAFSGGEFENISLTSDGHLELAPALTNVAEATDPIIWAVVQDKKGNVYFGTGNQGKVYKLTPSGELSTFFEPNAVMVHALAIDGEGRLYAATSPDGCVYRLTSDGRAEVFCNPGEKYIWAMAFGNDGALFLATGNHGKILRVPSGDSLPAQAETYFESSEDNITTLALDNDGNLLAGSSPHGFVFRIDAQKHGFVLFNSGDKEIKQIAVAPDGVIYASTFVSNPKSGESSEEGPITISISPTEDGNEGGGSGNGEGVVIGAGSGHSASEIKMPSNLTGNDNKETGNGDVVMIGGQSSLETAMNESEDMGEEKSLGAIYQIDTNGFCGRYWSVPGEAVYSMVLRPDGTLIAGMGEKGRLYSIHDENHWKLLQETSEGAQVAALLPDTRHAGRFFAATSNPAKLYRLDLSLAEDGVYTSAAFDAKQKSQWGRLHPMGEIPGGTKLEISTRTGNIPKPGNTWSDWSEPHALESEIAVASPNARYLQYRVAFKRDKSSPGATACLQRMEFYYQNLNAPPVITRIKVHNEGFSVSKMPMPDMGGDGQQASLSDLLGNGDSGDGDSSKSDGQNAGEQVMITLMAQPPLRTIKNPGYCTVVWQAKDPNNDKLIYSVSIRAEGNGPWTKLVDKTEDTFYSFDTTGLREGLYVIKVTASDLPANTPETARITAAVSEAFLINNTPPTLTVQSQSVKREKADIIVKAADAASIIESATYSVDGKEEVALRPEDLIFDSRNETFDIQLNGLSKGTHSLLVRAQDDAKNAAVLQLNFEVK